MKHKRLLLLPAMALFLSACVENSYEVHNISFYPLVAGAKEIYADQVEDSTFIVSTDNWTVESTADWLTVSPESHEVRPGYIEKTKLTLLPTPNTTGETRGAALQVTSASNIRMEVSQSYWLNILSPAPRYIIAELNPGEGKAGAGIQKVYFPMNLSAATTDTTVIFRVYQDNATLTSDAEWLKPEVTTFEKGRHSVKIKLEPNTANEARNANLTLTSAGVSTPIEVKQAAANEQ